MKSRIFVLMLKKSFAVLKGESRVANNFGNNVTELRASDGALLGNFNSGAAPAWVAFDGASVWVTNANGNTVSKF